MHHIWSPLVHYYRQSHILLHKVEVCRTVCSNALVDTKCGA